MIKNEKKKVYFICCTSNHIFHSIYLANQPEFENVNMQRILILKDTLSVPVPTQFLINYFEEIIRIANYETKNGKKRKDRFIKRCLYAGWLFPFSEVGRKLLKESDYYKLYCFSDWDSITKKVIHKVSKKNGEIILVEEGLATYSMGVGRKLPIKNRIINFFLGVGTEPYIGRNPRIDTLMVRYPQKLPKEKTNGRQINKLPNIFLDNVWTSQFSWLCNKAYNVNNAIYSENFALWLGQPLENDGLINKNMELEWLKCIADLLNPQLTLVIKSHPREDIKKYDGLKQINNIRIIDMGKYAWLPGELIFSNLNPCIVLTPFSTAASFLIKKNSNLKIVYCYEMMGIPIDEALKKVLEGNRAYQVASIEQLKEILYNLKEYNA